MTLVRWNPSGRRAISRDFRDDFESLIEDFLGAGYHPTWGVRPQRAVASGYVPRVDIIDNEKDLVLKAEVPGLEKADLDVTITKDVITIKGERKEQTEEDSNECFYCRESSIGSFERRVALPVEVVAEKAEAKLHNGVLTLILPKAEAKGSVKIAVN